MFFSKKEECHKTYCIAAMAATIQNSTKQKQRPKLNSTKQQQPQHNHLPIKKNEFDKNKNLKK